MIFLDDMYKDIFIDDKLKGKVFVDKEIRDNKDDYFESTDMFQALFGLNKEIEHHYLRLISQTKSSEYISKIAKTPQERFYILYIVLRNYVTNKNLQEGISGVTIQYHKYYKMYQLEGISEVFIPEPATPKKSKISKATMEEIGAYNKEADNTSYDTSKHIIQRSDFCYEKIHLFEKYEFSNNIAYEFAKRSRYPFAELEDIHILKHVIIEIYERSNPGKMALYDDKINFIHEIINNDNNFCALFNLFINQDFTIKDLYNDFFHLPSIHKSRFYTEYKDYFEENLQHYEFVFEDMAKNIFSYNHSIFLPRYKSPTLNETVLYSNDYRINIALPEDELVSYILKLKKDFEKSISSTNINLFELMFGYHEHYHDEIASMLFIYDSIRVGFKYEHIEHSLNDYDAKNINANINKKVPKDKKTIRKYFFYAKLLIEEEYYRLLVAPIYDNETINEFKDKINQIKKSNA